MTSILHQAVELAQAGQREEARRLLWQYLQTSPDTEVAWLWLASVAADQTEYERALTEVLRINPANQQARTLLDQFRQQFARPAAMPGTPAPTGVVPPAAPPRPSPYEGVYVGVPPQEPPRYAPAYTPPPVMGQPVTPPEAQVRVEYVEKKRRGPFGCGLPGCFGCMGCGCWQSCLVALILLIVLPAVACGALSLAPVSLGPLDVPAAWLPNDMGRKTIRLETTGYEISFEAPRSWYLADANNEMWKFWRDLLEQGLPFVDETASWKTFESTSDHFVIVEVDPIVLSGAPSDGVGGPTVLRVSASQRQQGDFTCAAVQQNSSQYAAVYKYEGGLCGYRTDDLEPMPPDLVLKNVTAPAQQTVITFVTPINAQTGVTWTLTLPRELVNHYKDDIDALIASVKIKEI
ncbi:MAG: tetratricopeptide repeat protein [Aggregatilineaceae bacterium]